MTEKKVKMEEIDLDSSEFDRYLVSFKPDIAPMVNSIGRIGLINPVILVDEEPLRIVSGLKRVRACRQLDVSAIDAKIFRKGEKSFEELLRIAIYENLSARKLLELEKGIALLKLHNTCRLEAKALIEEFAESFEIPPVWDKFLEYMSVAQLEERVKEALAKGRLEFQACIGLAKLKKEERDALFDRILSKVRMNLNESVGFISEMSELPLTLNKSMLEMCELEDIRRIIGDRKLNERGKGTAVRELVRKLRYPELSSREDAFKKEVKKISPGSSIRIQHPPYFEGDFLSIYIKSEKPEKLLSQFEMLRRNLDLKIVKKLFKIIQES